MTGTQIANYKIEEKLGEGGMGIVYKAIDVGLDRPQRLLQESQARIEAARTPTWYFSGDGKTYRIQVASDSVQISPTTSGFVANIPIKTDKRVNRRSWDSGNLVVPPVSS